MRKLRLRLTGRVSLTVRRVRASRVSSRSSTLYSLRRPCGNTREARTCDSHRLPPSCTSCGLTSTITNLSDAKQTAPLHSSSGTVLTADASLPSSSTRPCLPTIGMCKRGYTRGTAVTSSPGCLTMRVTGLEAYQSRTGKIAWQGRGRCRAFTCATVFQPCSNPDPSQPRQQPCSNLPMFESAHVRICAARRRVTRRAAPSAAARSRTRLGPVSRSTAPPPRCTRWRRRPRKRGSRSSRTCGVAPRASGY